MRKIFCYSDSLLELYYKDFERDCNKFFRASKITLEHMNTSFEHKGSTWKILGQIDDKEMVCRNLVDNTVWAIERTVVQRCILGETNIVFEKRKLKPLNPKK
jgi:hypothetical protein